jgi:hypothetical protein
VHGGDDAFFSGVARTKIVQGGGDSVLPKDRETGRSGHTIAAVHRHMFLTVCRWYTALPDPRTLTGSEIRFFYEGLRHELHEVTKPRKKSKG